MLKMRCGDKQHESAERKQLRGRRERTNGCFNREPRCEEKFICGMTPSRGPPQQQILREGRGGGGGSGDGGLPWRGTVWVYLFAARNEGEKMQRCPCRVSVEINKTTLDARRAYKRAHAGSMKERAGMHTEIL